jgi:hypothetical protein
MEEIEWLECLPLNGEEKSLPTGGQIRAPGVVIQDFVKTIIKAPKSGAVIGVIDEDVYNAIVATYGERGSHHIVLTAATSLPDKSGRISTALMALHYGLSGVSTWRTLDLESRL